MRKSLLQRAAFFSLARIFSRARLWRSALRCFQAVLRYFFLLQYRAALFRRKTIVSSVDHPLDGAIPFDPRWVTIYMDFSPFWIRISGFLIERFGKAGVEEARSLFQAMADLYQAAASVYRHNFSTTRRPRCCRNVNFLVIHLFDPHLMCIPSLHVLVVISAWIRFRAALARLDTEGRFAEEEAWARRHALRITESILYVKQHSINCVSAALYTLTSLDGGLFPPEEMSAVIGALLRDSADIAEGDKIEIKRYIEDLYRRFLSERQSAQCWQEPLLNFLKEKRGC
jgi:hypothetical protein